MAAFLRSGETVPRTSTTHEPTSDPASDETSSSAGDRMAAAVGPITALRMVVLLVAVAFLAASVGWAVGVRPDDPLNRTDVGFLREMGYHHEQAVEMSLILLYKDDVDQGLDAFAHEIIIGQRFEQGLFNAILDRFGHDAAVDPDGEVMAWMGPPMAPEEMPGLATPAQIAALEEASGAEAEALWIALMTEHHLGGLHMADRGARHGSDPATVSLAGRLVEIQRSEVIDLDRYRRRNGLPIPDGFANPLDDQRLNPLSLTES
jgi:uncharacterized protein (DUF305 family)